MIWLPISERYPEFLPWLHRRREPRNASRRGSGENRLVDLVASGSSLCARRFTSQGHPDGPDRREDARIDVEYVDGPLKGFSAISLGLHARKDGGSRSIFSSSSSSRETSCLQKLIGTLFHEPSRGCVGP